MDQLVLTLASAYLISKYHVQFGKIHISFTYLWQLFDKNRAHNLLRQIQSLLKYFLILTSESHTSPKLHDTFRGLYNISKLQKFR